MSYQHKSGALKRKERDQAGKMGQLPIGRFFMPSISREEKESSPTATVTCYSSENVENELPTVSEESSEDVPTKTQVISLISDILPSQEHERKNFENYFDVGDTNLDIKSDLHRNHEKLPPNFPVDCWGDSVPMSIFKKRLVTLSKLLLY